MTTSLIVLTLVAASTLTGASNVTTDCYRSICIKENTANLSHCILNQTCTSGGDCGELECATPYSNDTLEAIDYELTIQIINNMLNNVKGVKEYLGEKLQTGPDENRSIADLLDLLGLDLETGNYKTRLNNKPATEGGAGDYDDDDGSGDQDDY